MQINGRGAGCRQWREGADVIDVAVCQQIGHDDGVHLIEADQQLCGVVTGIDDHGLASGGIGDQITIFFDKPRNPCFNIHGHEINRFE